MTQKRYRSYPAVDAALVETRARFGVGVQQNMITDEMREIASRFDVVEEIKKAESQRRGTM
jgi:alkyl hydroperoxide reductase subunit AhpC